MTFTDRWTYEGTITKANNRRNTEF